MAVRLLTLFWLVLLQSAAAVNRPYVGEWHAVWKSEDITYQKQARTDSIIKVKVLIEQLAEISYN